MRVLVIGGSRFIGLHVVRELVNKGYDTWVFNRGNNNENLPSDVNVIVGNRRHTDSLQYALGEKQFDAVIDMCAYTREDTEKLLAVLPENIRFLHTSSGAVYKQTHKFPITEDFPLGFDPDEGDYGLNKIAIEELLAERLQKGLRATILRPGYVYGPENYIYRESRFFERIEKGKPILIPGSGEVLTQCVYAPDVAQAFIKCLENSNTIGESYNVMQRHAYTLKGYIEEIFKAMGKTTEIVTFNPKSHGLVDSEVEKIYPFRWERNVVRSISKAERDFSFKPITLEQGMKTTYEWWKQHGTWQEKHIEIEEQILEQIRETDASR